MKYSSIQSDRNIFPDLQDEYLLEQKPRPFPILFSFLKSGAIMTYRLKHAEGADVASAVCFHPEDVATTWEHRQGQNLARVTIKLSPGREEHYSFPVSPKIQLRYVNRDSFHRGKTNSCKDKMYFAIFFIGIVVMLLTSCSKLVEVDPPITNVNGENVFNEDGSAIAVLTGIYTNMSKADINTGQGWLTNICFTTGLTGDELDLWNTGFDYYAQYYHNNISPGEVTWLNIYRMIFITNSAIEGLANGTLLTPIVKKQLLGEAKFIRALCYFYLVNLYGDVPLALVTDYKKNEVLPRTPKNDVYQQIIKDLTDAEALLNEDYVDKDAITISFERLRPNKWVAKSLLSRVYLYTGNYAEAESQATSIINHTSLYQLVELNSVFLMNSKEAIWQLQPVGLESEQTANTREGQIFKLLEEIGPSDDFPVYLSQDLVNSFDEKDQRSVSWINTITIGNLKYPYPYKYKIGRETKSTQEYSTIFRLGEQYLIRAEARIQQNKISEGVSDLNILRTRATDLTALPTDQFRQLPLMMSQADALLLVEDERRHELFTEWGHRWLDLKRTERANILLKNVKLGWQPTDVLFPIPSIEVEGNPGLKGQQNPGYN